MAEFYSLDVEATAAELKADKLNGLTSTEAQRRLTEHGRNVLPTGEDTSVWKILLSQFTDIMVIVLIAAAVISIFLNEVEDSLVILVIVVLNALLGTYQEYRAEQALSLIHI